MTIVEPAYPRWFGRTPTQCGRASISGLEQARPLSRGQLVQVELQHRRRGAAYSEHTVSISAAVGNAGHRCPLVCGGWLGTWSVAADREPLRSIASYTCA